MRNRLFLVFSLATFFSFGQKSVEFHPIAELNQDSSAYKVILISAPWCGVCKANHEMLENSDAIFDAISSSVTFFEMENDFKEPIEFGGRTFHFVQRGPSVGEHALIAHILNGEEIIYPTFVLFDSTNEKIAIYHGFVNESEWVEIFGTILNHFESPDSVISN